MTSLKRDKSITGFLLIPYWVSVTPLRSYVVLGLSVIDVDQHALSKWNNFAIGCFDGVGKLVNPVDGFYQQHIGLRGLYLSLWFILHFRFNVLLGFGLKVDWEVGNKLEIRKNPWKASKNNAEYADGWLDMTVDSIFREIITFPAYHLLSACWSTYITLGPSTT